MEGESVPPPSEMEVGNLAQDAVPVKSLVDYSADVQHHENRQDDMDQATSHYGNGNGNDQSENHESKEMEEKVREEPKSEPFDVFGKMLSSMPAKSPSPPPATSGDEDGKKDSFDSDDEKNENDNDANDGNDDSEEKKDVFDTMFDKEKETEKEDDKEDKPPATDDLDENETKPEEDSTKDVSMSQDTENYREYSLPYNWKKVGHRRQTGTKTWDFYIITPCGKRLRSTVEVNKYLDQNPDVECDRDVTNTNRPSDLMASRASTSGGSGSHQRLSDMMVPVNSEQNFVEENISEAFKTLEVYQKALETERTRCIKTVKEGMSVVDATSITRKLRKLYAVTQKNMDLLDRAIVESFVENFPTESTRIHMGRVEPPPKYAAPAKRGAAKSKKKTQKSKVKIKPKKGKKGAAAKGKGKKGVIEMNGAPVYAEYDLPKKRKTYRESDVECIDVSEEDDSEYYNPKKRSKPGPASSKKSKPGPASKKKASYY